MAERLQKLIAQAGIASRRKAEELITSGRVKVNGKIVRELGVKAEPSDRIEVDGKLINREEKVYFLMNKPKNTLCTLSDDRDRETILNYVNEKQRVFPVGRLDYATTGLILLTNDGDFANKMMHPRYHLAKTYECAINGLITEDEFKQLRKGIPLEDGMTLPAKVFVISQNEAKKKTVLSITIFEGRNREIRRMMEYFHYDVIRLDRKSYGFLTYESLHQGEYRKLRMYEVRKLLELSDKGEVILD